MTNLQTLDPQFLSPTRRELRRILVRTALGALALTAGIFAAVPVSVSAGAGGFFLFAAASSAAVGRLLRGRLRIHSLCQFLAVILLSAAELLALWDVSPATNLLLFGAAQAGGVLPALFTVLLYGVIAFFTMFLVLMLPQYEGDCR